MIIWISSYPKSGNTYLRSFLSAYYFSEDGEFNFNLLKNIKQFPNKNFFSNKLNSFEDAVKNYVPAQKSIFESKKANFLKTHNLLGFYKGYPFTIPEYTLGAIYIVRDPRNVILSLMNHYSLSEKEALDFITDDVVERFCVLGEPEAHVEKLKVLENNGATQFNIYLDNGDEEKIIADYGEKIIPHF